MIVLMSVTTFTTQRQLTQKNMPASALQGPMAQQQKMLLYALPLIFAFSGVNFPLGVLIYWTTTNVWSMGQQFYVIRRNPTPGSEAERDAQGAPRPQGRREGHRARGRQARDRGAAARSARSSPSARTGPRAGRARPVGPTARSATT